MFRINTLLHLNSISKTSHSTASVINAKLKLNTLSNRQFLSGIYVYLYVRDIFFPIIKNYKQKSRLKFFSWYFPYENILPFSEEFYKTVHTCGLWCDFPSGVAKTHSLLDLIYREGTQRIHFHVSKLKTLN